MYICMRNFYKQKKKYYIYNNKNVINIKKLNREIKKKKIVCIRQSKGRAAFQKQAPTKQW